jgi:hypothetical protein
MGLLPLSFSLGGTDSCPFSPHLFTLAIELLVEAIRTGPDIHGFEMGPHTHKLTLFEDDLILFITNPEHHLSLIESITVF